MSTIESFNESIERLHMTSQLVFISLLRSHVPVPPSSLPLYRTAFRSGLKEVVDTGHMYTLELIMSIVSQFSWEELFPSPSESAQFSKTVRKFLSESSSKSDSVTTTHLSNILAMWAVISVK